MFETGMKTRLGETVTPEKTAASVASGALEVYATPCMCALMEKASYTCLAAHLPEGRDSVGVQLHVDHLSATPVGMSVSAEAEITSISEDGKRIDFKVTAWDESCLIGEGTHRRAVVTTERFLSRCQDKLSR